MRGLLISLLVLCVPAAGRAQDLCSVVAGASVIADDGEFLGKITTSSSSQSIFNEYGSFGSEYGAKSIWNSYGKYGGEYSRQSPFNKYTSTPPALVKGGEVIGYLTVNRSIRGAVNPFLLKSCDF